MLIVDNLRQKTFLIFGAGAVGGYYGGMIVRAGFDATFIARGENYKALKENGLTLIRDNKKEIIPINVVDKPDLNQYDYILICVKSAQTEEATKLITNNIHKQTSVVSLQNGVENEDIIASVIGKSMVIGGLVFIASRLTSPGVIEQFGYNGALIGELYLNEKTKRVLELQEILIQSGIDCKVSDDMRGDLWNKLVWNTSFNSLSVLTGQTVDKLLEEDYELVKAIMTEVRDVALAHGLNIRPDTVEFNLNRSKGFTGFKTSMLQDFERGKPLETEELVGVVIRKAKEKNIPVPNTERVYSQIKEKISVSI
ncbi:MAG: hypothetical protein A3I68_05605 [Candidatus Melainabacteria bacterium RIFCSPLOWO2_02_FULL_35_15]|nr:MAG: hypothetical protein A3F80_06075 [Candidatus Melainabacteria bacterium RIFCSPLOWO2_12_FULL_35_11]OGI13337.1 MAG: hypothetical protein A3I68_05605 [Candidatus Melainabacteria bacterium RIFCSPLOWO2_02_FULL_35_15]